MNDNEQSPPDKNWQPLTLRQRRVVGVLIEKAKTTPDAYPMTLNALVAGSNQKSNRSPQLQLDTEDVADTLDQLRAIHAVVEVHGDGRVAKFKHMMYEWLGVNKVELAIMGELLLRGEQSVGDLRGRASRMERIESVAALQPLLQGLMDRGLVIALTPAGRGQLVTHGLYPEAELNQVRQHLPNPTRPASTSTPAQSAQAQSAQAQSAQAQSAQAQSAQAQASQSPAPGTSLAALQSELESLKAKLQRVMDRVEALENRSM